MEYYNDMEFEIRHGFAPNMNNSDRLKVLEVHENSVVIKMNKAVHRGVFPKDNLRYWIKRGLLVNVKENKRTS